MLQTVTILITIGGMLACPLRCWADPGGEGAGLTSVVAVSSGCHCGPCSNRADEPGQNNQQDNREDDCSCNCLCQGAIPVDKLCLSGDLSATSSVALSPTAFHSAHLLGVETACPLGAPPGTCLSARAQCALLQTFSL